MLTACASTSANDPSAAPSKPKDFCHAMEAAVLLAPAAAEALNTLYTTMDSMAAGPAEGDIDTLHTVGAATTSSSETYAAALGTAADLAPDTLKADISALQEYWTLYAVGLGQIAESAPTYGNLVDQATALSTSSKAIALVADQPATQQRINDGYLAECTS